METSKELKFILAYMSKSMGFTDPNEYAFNQDQQFTFEAIFFSIKIKKALFNPFNILLSSSM